MTSIDAKAAARVIDAMRRGWPVRIEDADGALRLLAVEGAGDGDIADFGAGGLLLSAERAATLKLINQAAAASGPVAIALGDGDVGPRARAIADPTLDMAQPMKGPFRSLALTARGAAAAAVDLARLAHRLPAWYIAADGDGPIDASASVADIAAFVAADGLQLVTRARLPVSVAERAEIIGFRSPADGQDHVALVIGQPDDSVPVVRLHSECLTGDIFGSLKCDCGPQLDAALRTMADASWGVLLYLRQEGRGIGLINKMRAYMLQDQGFDTVDANLRLGFPVEARDFKIAARMLHLLHISAVRLLTNNPEKVAALAAEGVAVVERLPLTLPTNPHNARYLATKRDRTGHQL